MVSSCHRPPKSRRVKQSVILHFLRCSVASLREAPSFFRTGAGAHRVAPMVATNSCEGPHGSVTQWQILSAPTCVFIGLFSITESYMVDSASIMLVLEINPCMSKFTLFHGETNNGSLNHLRFLTCHDPTLKTLAIPDLISLPHPEKAAGAQLTYSRHGQVMTKKNNTGLFSRSFDWNK